MVLYKIVYCWIFLSIIGSSFTIVLAIFIQDSYAFNYVINTGSVVSQQNEEGFQNTVSGSYSFLQPDGKIREVRYKAEPRKGFRAYIKYRSPKDDNQKGHLRFPRDFQHPIRFADPAGIIPSSLLKSYTLSRKKHR